uniref:Uncharacterized protein n=1 Tax=Lotus japonicus TaxID=34305 RepID=I3S5E7_LOTJA|nr:unknown [Lotus japonicus]
MRSSKRGRSGANRSEGGVDLVCESRSPYHCATSMVAMATTTTTSIVEPLSLPSSAPSRSRSREKACEPFSAQIESEDEGIESKNQPLRE